MNKHLALTIFCACLGTSVHAQEIISQYEVFPTLQETDIPYRIPAIGTARNGDIVAVADFRYCRTDIGLMGTGDGRIDLRARISQDKGATWGNIFTVVKAHGRSSDEAFYTGFGDPCIVADRESGRVLQRQRTHMEPARGNIGTVLLTLRQGQERPHPFHVHRFRKNSPEPLH